MKNERARLAALQHSTIAKDWVEFATIQQRLDVALVADVIAMVNAVKPAALEALFPADHPDRLEESWRSRKHADLDAEFDKDASEERAGE